MTKQIFKVVTLGILGGLALFAIPFFLLKAVIFFLLIGFFIRRFAGSRRFEAGFAFAAGGPVVVNRRLEKWCKWNKRMSLRKSRRWLNLLYKMQPSLFVHWSVCPAY